MGKLLGQLAFRRRSIFTMVFVVPTMVLVFSTLVLGGGKMFSILDHPFSEAEPVLRTSEASFSVTEKTAGARLR